MKAMKPIIFMADKSIVFTNSQPTDDSYVLNYKSTSDLLLANILKILETNNKIAIYAADLDPLFDLFVSQFLHVEAAGGVVRNQLGEVLMILRGSRWELPKGHLESGELLDECAMREVTEETGVDGLTIERYLCDTYHFYLMHSRWELKITHWYEMNSSSTNTLKPQVEEGISLAAWCSPSMVEDNIKRSFPTIRNVIGML